MPEFLAFIKDIFSSPVTLALAGVVIGALLSTWGGLWQLKLKLREERQWQIDTKRIERLEEVHADLQRFRKAVFLLFIKKSECMRGDCTVRDVDQLVVSDSIKFDYNYCRIEMIISMYAPELKGLIELHKLCQCFR